MFYVAEDVQKHFDEIVSKNEEKLSEWQSVMDKFAEAHPEKAQEIQRRFAYHLPENWADSLPPFTIGQDKDLATRQMSQKCIDSISSSVIEFVGGSADLTPSNLTRPKGASVDYQKESPEGRYFRFGVREHGMVAISNGMFAYGGMRPYCATFLTFMGYCAGAIRLSALSKLGVIFVFTHDSIGLGEDGPTHQPIEQLENMRSMPNLNVWRPADTNEMNAAYKSGMELPSTPTVICCSRSKVAHLYGSSLEKASKGGYICVDVDDCALVLVSTGSEVEFCVKAAEKLTSEGISTRVVSMPCQEVFLQQDKAYRASVLPGDIPTLSVEAAAICGWHQFSHAQICMTTYGASGKGDDVFKHFGFSPENVAAKGKELVDYYKNNGPVPDLNNRPILYTVYEGGH
jgi:transketolase